MTDPLGYDTDDYLRKMARDALEGRNEDAVEAEADRLRQAPSSRRSTVRHPESRSSMPTRPPWEAPSTRLS